MQTSLGRRGASRCLPSERILRNNISRCIPCSAVKSDAKIEITITTTHLIRIKYPLSSFNRLSDATKIANFNKIHLTVFEQQLFKNGTQKQKSRFSSSYTIPSVTVCAQSGRHLHRHLHVSCADRTFSAAAGLPVCRSCSIHIPQKSVQC